MRAPSEDAEHGRPRRGDQDESSLHGVLLDLLIKLPVFHGNNPPVGRLPNTHSVCGIDAKSRILSKGETTPFWLSGWAVRAEEAPLPLLQEHPRADRGSLTGKDPPAGRLRRCQKWSPAAQRALLSGRLECRATSHASAISTGAYATASNQAGPSDVRGQPTQRYPMAA